MSAAMRVQRVPTPDEVFATKGQSQPISGGVTLSNHAGVGAKTPPVKTGFGKQRSTGLSVITNNVVKTTPLPISPNKTRFPLAYIWADRANTDFIRFGSEDLVSSGGPDLNAGDSVPLTDVAPNDVWVVANSGTQKVYFVGHGDPNAVSVVALSPPLDGSGA